MYNLIIKQDNNIQYRKIINLECASTFRKRLIGLMFKEEFNGLIFKQKEGPKIISSIHTSFMKVPIDILYIDKNLSIKEMKTLKPWKIHIPQTDNIKYIIELPENTIKKYKIKINQKVVIIYEKTRHNKTKKSYSNSNEHYKKQTDQRKI